MTNINILFNDKGDAKTINEIRKEILAFKYSDATSKIIQDSEELNQENFINCASYILSSFGMTRGGIFNDPEKRDKILLSCWNEVEGRLKRIHDSVIESKLSRDRYLLELNDHKREDLITEIWSITKKILPFTMGKYSYGLVGASKILFSVLPEIVLPVDNRQWLHVFQTVDLGDVIRIMTFDIKRWENATDKKLNEMDSSNRLTTLPSVYNVMAMAAK
jgi:hypothetical protein